MFCFSDSVFNDFLYGASNNSYNLSNSNDYFQTSTLDVKACWEIVSWNLPLDKWRR